MGYILPVQYTQYQEYQKRIKGVKSSYSRTVGIEKLKRPDLSQLESPLNKKVPVKFKHSNRKKSGTEKIYADLTGIGGIINERI